MALPDLLGPLYEALPLEKAMARLVQTDMAPDHPCRPLVAGMVATPALASHRDLVAGLWLYVDQLDASHQVSQKLTCATGSFWHGIMHRREGDFANSHYWFDRAADHPLLHDGRMEDPHVLVEDVAASHRQGDHPDANLLERQRREWQTLFDWCLNPITAP